MIVYREYVYLDHFEVLDLELVPLVEDGCEDDVLAVAVHHRASVAVWRES